MTQSWKVLQDIFDRVIRSPLNELDLVAVDTFCSILQSDHGQIIQATEIIGSTIQSKNEREALNALKLLDEAMSQCGKPFQMKVGKNRFLNKICPIFQKDFYNDSPPLKSVQNKALDMFLAWTVQYPEQTKIKIAYEQLTKQQGVVHAPVNQIQRIPKENKNVTPAQQQTDNDDVMKLKQLLQSKNPLDVNAANIMIQTMLEKDNRRNRLKTEREEELKKASGSLQLLDEMLDNFVCYSCTDDELQIMKDLYESCMKLQPTILRIAQDIENNELLQAALEENDKLNDIVEKYKSKVDIKTEEARTENLPASITPGSILDFAPAEEAASTVAVSDNNFDDLCSIAWETPVQSTVTNQELLEPMKPDDNNAAKMSNIMSLYEKTIDSNQFDSSPVLAQPTPPATMPMTKINIPIEADEKPKDKRSLLDSEMDEIIQGLKIKLQPNSNNCNESTNNLNSTEACDNEFPANDISNEPHAVDSVCEDSKDISESINDSRLQTLNDLVIDIDSIRPGPVAPRTVHESRDGVKVVFNFAEDHPVDGCMVIVVTILNMANNPITTFQFNATVTQPNYLRLLPSSGNELPATKPFRQPTGEITQILLLLNPSKEAVSMECELKYFDGSAKVTKSFDVMNVLYV